VPLEVERTPRAIAEAAALTPALKLLVVCNPNDPDGSLMPASAIKELRDLLPESVLLVIDEALVDYAGTDHSSTTASLAQDAEGIVLVRTMSKAWGLAGLRVGWMIGGDDSRELFARMSPLLGVSGPSEAGAIAALKEAPNTPARRAREVRRQITRLEKLLRGTSIEIGTTATNFVWIKIPGLKADDIAERVFASGVKVMNGSSVGSDSHVRATLRSDETATERLAEGLLAAAMAAGGQARSPAD
jgi:histidinol-phosphate aminotransferase